MSGAPYQFEMSARSIRTALDRGDSVATSIPAARSAR